MRILFIADGRSPTTKSWIAGVAGFGDEIHLITTYPCKPIEGIASMTFLPLAFSQVGREHAVEVPVSTDDKPGQKQKSATGNIISRFRKAFLSARYILGPLSLHFTVKRYRELLEKIHPDLVHALRIPYEGMIAGFTPEQYPVIISSWGNDFTLHADKTPFMVTATRRAVRRADGFMADCRRDIRLAKEWGLRDNAPAMFAPGSGGLNMEKIRQKLQSGVIREQAVINPRGIRPVYVLNDNFFQSLPTILKKYPGLSVYCAVMRSEPDAEKWIKSLNLPENVHLLPGMPQNELWDYSLRSRVVVSPAIHDGTPNSVLESMVLGCIPVVGDIETLREWITDGENGLLVDPEDPAAIASGILRALEDDELFERAQKINMKLIQERADVEKVMPEVHQFYLRVARVR
jgi:glycosyltransferase involved in cell wall biosynthesis